jgi:pimeloyl-ACP methyl ester carboxylesterase
MEHEDAARDAAGSATIHKASHRSAGMRAPAMTAPDIVPVHEDLAMRAGVLRVTRAGAGAPVILLHGGFGCWAHWIGNISALASERLVIAPDLPGFGASWDPGHCLSPEEQASVVLEMMDLLGIESAHLAGFSFGTLVAVHLALAQPQRVRSVTLVNLPGVGERTPEALALPSRLSALSREQGKRAGVNGSLRELMLCQHQLIDDALVDLIGDSIARCRYVTRSISKASQMIPLLAQLQCPAMVMIGARDPFHSNDLEGRRARIDAVLGAGAVRIVPDAAHWLQYDQADVFNRALIKFTRAGKQT